jgi:hypothetical protein
MIEEGYFSTLWEVGKLILAMGFSQLSVAGRGLEHRPSEDLCCQQVLGAAGQITPGIRLCPESYFGIGGRCEVSEC